MPDLFTPPLKKVDPDTSAGNSEESKSTPQIQTDDATVMRNLNAPRTSGRPLNLLASFHINPLGVKFQNQEKDEHIILFIRRHFITNIPWIFFSTLLMLIPPFAIFLLQFSGLQLFMITPQLLFVLLAFYYLIILSYALMQFIIWFYHVGIVTQKRLLDLDVYNILSHHIAETEIADIVDVSYSQHGFFQSFFNYGDVPIQTEAIKANFEFEMSPKPAVVSDIITDLRPKRQHN